MTEPVSLYQRRAEKLADALEARLLRAEIAYAVDRYAEYFERHGLTVHISWGRDTKPSDNGNVVLFFPWDKAGQGEGGAGGDGGAGDDGGNDGGEAA
jgi:hypothetical protein